MKIQKFNENKNITPEYIALLFYNVGGEVSKSVLFENEEDFGNYVLNYINKFILSETFYSNSMLQHMKVNKDENGVPYFLNWEKAYDWFNEYNEKSEPTLGYIECKLKKNIKLSNRISVARDTKNFNL